MISQDRDPAINIHVTVYCRIYILHIQEEQHRSLLGTICHPGNITISIQRNRGTYNNVRQLSPPRE
jgi:hypothetical protein